MYEEDADEMRTKEVSVRRCLFERPDADTTRHDLERVWTELQRNSSVMWNFDFARQRPFSGPIVWTHNGDVWLGKISADSERNSESIASYATSTRADVRDHTRRPATDHTTRVIKSPRLTPRRQSRVTGEFCSKIVGCCV